MLHFEKIKIFFLLVLSLIEASPPSVFPEKPMVILITSYNNKNWVNQNLTSVFSQDYSNYRVIYIDDASSDGTADGVESVVRDASQEARVTIVRNSVRKGALCNIYNAVWGSSDEEIIVSLDGDDWLANDTVLKTVNAVYTTREVWLTHGTLIEYPKKALGWSVPIPSKAIKRNTFRTFRCPSHLRTFYAWLFKKIDLEDLKYQGEFFPMTWDQAMMFPMIEMAGDRHAFIPQILYVYNTANPINDNKTNPKLQTTLEKLIRSKTPYARLQEAPQ